MRRAAGDRFPQGPGDVVGRELPQDLARRGREVGPGEGMERADASIQLGGHDVGTAGPARGAETEIDVQQRLKPQRERVGRVETEQPGQVDAGEVLPHLRRAALVAPGAQIDRVEQLGRWGVAAPGELPGETSDIDRVAIMVFTIKFFEEA